MGEGQRELSLRVYLKGYLIQNFGTKIFNCISDCNEM